MASSCGTASTHGGGSAVAREADGGDAGLADTGSAGARAGTLRGMQVRGSSRELGRLTTVAVVQSIFLVILADALFAVLFLELDI